MLLTRDTLPADDCRYRCARRPAVPPEPGADRRSPQGRRRHHDPRRRRQDGADAGGPCQGRRCRSAASSASPASAIPPSRTGCRRRGVETINCDLLDEAAIKALPKAPNIVFMAGRKFGAEGDLSLTWAMNSHVPALVAQAFAGFAHRRVLDRLRLSVRAGQRQGRRTRTWRPIRPANTRNPASGASACSSISRRSIRRPDGCSG